MDFNEIKSISDKYLMPTYNHFPVALASGKNATLTASDGREIIDFTSGIGVNIFGVNDDGWKNAVTQQIEKIQHTSNLYYNETVAVAAKLLCEKSGFDKVLFCNSGAEANECAIKLARKYSYDRYGENRSTIISLVNSFHGRTMATITATGQEHYHKFFMPFVDGFKYAEVGNKEAFSELLDGTVCAVILEVIQGEGGVLLTPSDYIKYIRQLCDENDIILIFDEVQTGVGRTGKLYAWENIGVKPDVLTSAKGLGGGLPVGACLATDKFGSTLTAGTHGTTFGGNPVVLAGAIEILNRIDDEFLKSVREKGEYIKNKVITFDDVSEVRGMGLMIGVDLKTKKAADVAARCVEKGLLILTAKQSLRMLPPLTVTKDEIDKGLEILKNVLAE